MGSLDSASVPAAQQKRVRSIDVIRGVVMLLMAIDHVRVYSGLPAGGPTPAIFFTRWITHFCAPAFVFLAGTSAFLHGERLGDRAKTSRYLVTRGLVLIALELTVLRVAWTFNLDFAHYLLAGVIWMIGWCMILLAALIWLPLPAIAAFALIVVAGHNVVDLLPAQAVQPLRGNWIWQLVYFGGLFQAGTSGPTVAVLYSIVPWIGVMAAGYAFGAIVTKNPADRDRWCLIIGGIAIAVFLVLRGFDIYGDPRPWQAAQPSRAPALLRFLNTTKYPASLLFLLMTLGPPIALAPAAERMRGRLSEIAAVFGRVPMFYYVLHIPLIHLSALVVSLVREGRVDSWLFANHPMMPPPPPDGYTWSLALLYLVFFLVIALLYMPCRWYAKTKSVAPARWHL